MKTAAAFVNLFRRMLVVSCGSAVLVASVAARAGNIFDDNWTPPTSAVPPKAALPIAARVPLVSVTPKSDTREPVTSEPVTREQVTPEPPTPEPVTITPPPPTAPAVRRPIPAKPDQERSRSALKEVFAAQMKDQTLTGRRKLAGLLFDAVAKSTDNPSDQYVLLGGTINAAREGADLPLCFQAADFLSLAFEVDGVKLKTDAALNTTLRAGSPTETTENLRAALAMVDSLVAEDDLSSAARLCGLIKPLVATDPFLRPAVLQRGSEVELLRTEQERFNRQLEILKTTSNDPAANLAVGRYYCFSRGWWDKGLPYLFRGSDADLKKAAAMELAGDKAPESNESLGDAWWAIGDKQVEPARARAREHAAVFYQKAVGSATGLGRIKMEERIAKVAAAETEAMSRRSDGATLALTDAAKAALIHAQGLFKTARSNNPRMYAASPIVDKKFKTLVESAEDQITRMLAAGQLSREAVTKFNASIREALDFLSGTHFDWSVADVKDKLGNQYTSLRNIKSELNRLPGFEDQNTALIPAWVPARAAAKSGAK